MQPKLEDIYMSKKHPSSMKEAQYHAKVKSFGLMSSEEQGREASDVYDELSEAATSWNEISVTSGQPSLPTLSLVTQGGSYVRDPNQKYDKGDSVRTATLIPPTVKPGCFSMLYKGNCKDGDKCSYAHDTFSLQRLYDLKLTEMLENRFHATSKVSIPRLRVMSSDPRPAADSAIKSDASREPVSNSQYRILEREPKRFEREFENNEDDM